MSRKPFFRISSWYVKNGQGNAERLCAGTPEERQLWKSGKRQSKTVIDKKTGKPVRVSTKDFPITERVEKAFAKYTLADPATAFQAKGGTTVAQLVTIFMDNSTACDKTKSNYRRVLDRFVKTHGAWRIDAVNPVVVNQWLAKMEKAGAIGSTNSRYLFMTAIKMLFNTAVEAELIPTNKMRGKKLRYCARTRREVLIADSDRLAILEHASHAFQDFFTALLETGRRPDEIAHVKVTEVLELGGGLCCWRIRQHKNRNKPGKPGEPQIIDLSPTMIAMTRRLMAKPSSDGLLFHSPLGKRWREQLWNDAKDRAMKFAKAAGHELTPGLICYAARHTFVTKAMRNGVTSGDVADMVGNTAAVIESNYNHLSQQATEARQRRILAATAGDMSAFVSRTA